MVRSFACLVFLAVLATPVAFAADPPQSAAMAPAGTVPSTEHFLMQAASGNLFEIDSSKLAVSKSNSAEVKAFATRMLNDHGGAATRFKNAVSEAKLKAPPETLDDKNATTVKDLRSRSGGDFDKAYVDAQYQAHVEIVALFDGYAKGGENVRMTQFAQELLPTLRGHFDDITKLRSSMTGKSG